MIHGVLLDGTLDDVRETARVPSHSDRVDGRIKSGHDGGVDFVDENEEILVRASRLAPSSVRVALGRLLGSFRD